MLMHQFAKAVGLARFEDALDLLAEFLGEMEPLQHLRIALF
jgi:hypothetical protein